MRFSSCTTRHWRTRSLRLQDASNGEKGKVFASLYLRATTCSISLLLKHTHLTRHFFFYSSMASVGKLIEAPKLAVDKRAIGTGPLEGNAQDEYSREQME